MADEDSADVGVLRERVCRHRSCDGLALGSESSSDQVTFPRTIRRLDFYTPSIMDRLHRLLRPHHAAKPIPLPMAYYLLREPIDDIDHFMLEVDADGTPRREVGLDRSGAIVYTADDDHDGSSRCLWHQQFGWEIESFLQDASEPLTADQFEATWATRPR